MARTVASGASGATISIRSGRIASVSPAEPARCSSDARRSETSTGLPSAVAGTSRAVLVPHRQEVHEHRADKVCAKAVRGTVVDLVRRAELLEDAEIHDCDLVRHAQRLDLVVRHIDHRLPALVLDALQLCAHVGAEGSVEIRERLVEEEDRRLDDHRASQRDLLHVVDGEAPGLAVERAGEADDLGDALDLAVDLFLTRPRLPDAQAERNVVVDLHVREDGVVLEDEADVSLAGIETADRHVVEVDLAGSRLLETCDHVHRRGLAAPGRPEERDERAVLGDEVELLDGPDVAEVLGQLLDPDLGHRCYLLIAPKVSPRTR